MENIYTRNTKRKYTREWARHRWRDGKKAYLFGEIDFHGNNADVLGIVRVRISVGSVGSKHFRGEDGGREGRCGDFREENLD